ncbi:uncharacterized protein L199_001511 [Kwoniella botswanensis]|uniref:uncharacterized protein n=1 Tax=Kwoniella botswanensis TaxID=1268659 RepID=UPI00315D97B2
MPAGKKVDTSHLTLDQIFVPGSAPSIDNRPDHALETIPNLPPEPDWTNAGFSFEPNQAEEFFERVDRLCLPPSESRSVDEMLAMMGIDHSMDVDGEEDEDEEEEDEDEEDEDEDEEDEEDEEPESGTPSVHTIDHALLDEMDEEEVVKAEFDQSEGVNVALTESKKDSQLIDFCSRFTKTQMQKEELKKFVEEYRIPVVECMVTNIKLENTPLYRFDEEGWVIQAFDWYSSLGHCHLDIIEIPEVDLLCERFLVPLFVAYQQNPHLEHIFNAKTSFINVERPGVYVMHPPWKRISKSIRKYENSGLISNIEADPITTPAYLGLTNSMQQRFQHHVQKPVNHRVAADNSDLPMSEWKYTMVAKFDGDEEPIPHIAMHIVHHVFLGIFSLTDKYLGGLNVSPVDYLHLRTLLPATTVIRMVKVVDKLLESHPERLLPRYRDSKAWRYFLQPLLPDECPVSGETLRDLLRGSNRESIFNRARPKHLIEYWDRLDDYPRFLSFLQQFGTDVPVEPATASFLFTREYPQTTRLLGTDPVQSLDALRQLVKEISEEYKF